MQLYHGTKTTDPLTICNDDEGFDIRFSANGIWGQAVYFAVNSIYSDGYAYNIANSTKQMFYAKV
jgi:hypothetical protein